MFSILTLDCLGSRAIPTRLVGGGSARPRRRPPPARRAAAHPKDDAARRPAHTPCTHLSAITPPTNTTSCSVGSPTPRRGDHQAAGGSAAAAALTCGHDEMCFASIGALRPELHLGHGARAVARTPTPEAYDSLTVNSGDDCGRGLLRDSPPFNRPVARLFSGTSEPANCTSSAWTSCSSPQEVIASINCCFITLPMNNHAVSLVYVYYYHCGHLQRRGRRHLPDCQSGLGLNLILVAGIVPVSKLLVALVILLASVCGTEDLNEVKKNCTCRILPSRSRDKTLNNNIFVNCDSSSAIAAANSSHIACAVLGADHDQQDRNEEPEYRRADIAIDRGADDLRQRDRRPHCHPRCCADDVRRNDSCCSRSATAYAAARIELGNRCASPQRDRGDDSKAGRRHAGAAVASDDAVGVGDEAPDDGEHREPNRRTPEEHVRHPDLAVRCAASRSKARA